MTEGAVEGTPSGRVDGAVEALQRRGRKRFEEPKCATLTWLQRRWRRVGWESRRIARHM